MSIAPGIAVRDRNDLPALVELRPQRRSPRFLVRAVQFGLDKAEIRTVNVEWELSRASAGLRNARIRETGYSLAYPVGSIRPAEEFRYPPC